MSKEQRLKMCKEIAAVVTPGTRMTEETQQDGIEALLMTLSTCFLAQHRLPATDCEELMNTLYGEMLAWHSNYNERN